MSDATNFCFTLLIILLSFLTTQHYFFCGQNPNPRHTFIYTRTHQEENVSKNVKDAFILILSF